MAKPGSTLCRFWMVRTKSPAPTTMSSRLKPICKATQVRRNRREPPTAGIGLLGEGLGQARIPELQRGRETEKQAGGERRGDRENENAPVERGEKWLVRIAGHPVNQQMQSLRSDESPSAAPNAQEQAFRQKLAKDLASWWRQERSARKNSAPAAAPHQQKAGNVDHGHGHNEKTHAHDDMSGVRTSPRNGEEPLGAT